MGEVIGLKQARRRRDRAAKEAQAAANRVAFGRTRAEKAADADEAARAAARLDGAKRQPEDG